ncbi:hypothetical protein N9Y42_04190 [Mariniblastus sp.]|nr:hypothetical protein [Mariniblastus sp.]
MKLSISGKTFLYLILTSIVVTSVGCGPDFGEKLVVKKTEIYYKDGATKADAEKLQEKLEEMELIDDKPKSVQLTKRGDVWEFRLATGDIKEAEAAKNSLKLYCAELSSAFDGDEVEVHLCNQKLETKSIVTGLSGLRYALGGNTYFYEDVDLDQVKNFASIAFGAQLDSGAGHRYHLSKPESGVEIRVTYPKLAKGNKRLAVAARDTAVAASKNVFGGKKVDVLICDEYFEPQETFSSNQQPAKTAP